MVKSVPSPWINLMGRRTHPQPPELVCPGLRKVVLSGSLPHLETMPTPGPPPLTARG